MNIDIFEEALELRNKQILCEDIMKYLSDPEAVKGMKYKELLATFAKTFESEFMMFVHTMGVKAAEAFYELHDCCPDCGCDNCATEEPETPPADAKFQLGDRVEVIDGIHRGYLGTIVGYDSDDATYLVMLDKYADYPEALPIYFLESSLSLYVEPVEPTEPTEPSEGDGDDKDPDTDENGDGDTDPAEGE